MQTPSNQTTGAFFPPPPATTPATPIAAPVTAIESQRVRLQSLQSSVNFQGVPTDTRGALQRSMEVEALIGLHDINPSFQPAARQVRVVSTPLGIPGSAAENCLLSAGSKPEDIDKMLIDFNAKWRSGWSADAAGQAGYLRQFPDGINSFTLLRDNGVCTNQIGVYVDASYVPTYVHHAKIMGCCNVVTEGEHANTKFGSAIWIPEKKGRKFTPIGLAVASMSRQVGKDILVAFDKKNRPGQRALCGDFSEAELTAINGVGGITLPPPAYR